MPFNEIAIPNRDLSVAVNTELSLRKENRIRFINQTPFVNVISGLKKNDTFVSLSSKDLNDTGMPYDMNIFRPKPGVINISSEYKNKFGSVRKLNIEWYCPNLEKLEELSPHFMTLGNTVYVEWGWTSGSNHSFFNHNDVSKYTINDIRNHINGFKSALFDAAIGITTNFSFSLNDDESFKCTLELTSIASMMESVMTTGNSISPNIINTGGYAFVTFKTYLNSGAYYDEIYRYFMGKKNLTDDNRIVLASSEQLLALEQAYAGNTVKSYKFEFNSIENPLYISWGFIEDVILGNNYNIYINTDIPTNLTVLNSTGNFVHYYEFIRSTDLTVCIFPIINTGRITKKENGKDVDDVRYLRYPNESFNLKDYNFNGEIRKILVHTEFFRKTMVSNNNIMDGIKAVLNKISEVCGGYFEFILTQNEKYKHWEVISLNALKKNEEYNRNNIYEFNISGGKSNISNMSFKTKLSNIAALNVFYNAQANDDITHGGDLSGNLYSVFDYESKDYIDIFGFENKIETKTEKETKSDSSVGDQIQTVMNISKNTIIQKHEKFRYHYLKRYLPVSDYGYAYEVHEATSGKVFNLDGEEGMRYGISSNILSEYGANSILSSIVPIDLTIELDGIAGFNISDAFICNFVVGNFSGEFDINNKFIGKGVFQIVGITDIVDNSGWKTQLKVNFRAIREIKNDLYKFVYNADKEFWNKVKVDPKLAHTFEKKKPNTKGDDKISYRGSEQWYSSDEDWALPVDLIINGAITHYGDDFIGYNNVTDPKYAQVFHPAIDIQSTLDDLKTPDLKIPIYSCTTGTVTWLSNNPAPNSIVNQKSTNLVYIQNNQFQLEYLHLWYVHPSIKIGSKVNRGQVIGYMGNTGLSGFRHVHIYCKLMGVQPLTYINIIPYLYKKLTDENLELNTAVGGYRKLPYLTAYQMTNFNFNGEDWINKSTGTLGKIYNITTVTDYAKMLTSSNGTNKYTLPNTNKLLILIGGLTSSDGATNVWGQYLINEYLGNNYGLIAIDYGNINGTYTSDHLFMKNLANQLNSNKEKYSVIQMVGHSSGAFALYYLINNLSNEVASKVVLYSLDQGSGQSNNREQSGESARWSVALKNRIKFMRVVSAKGGNIFSVGYPDVVKSFDNNDIIRISSSVSNPNKIKLHSAMIVTNPSGELEYAYYLNYNYRNGNNGSYITSWLREDF